MLSTLEYTKHDLGALCYPDRTEFRLWAPTATTVSLRLYPDGSTSPVLDEIALIQGESGVWIVTIPQYLHGTYYTYRLTIDGISREACDPYAKACGINGHRSMVVDLARTNPAGWTADHGPTLASPTDAILYELHIRDLSSDASSGIHAKGKFLGLTETGTKNAAGLSTGLDHIRALGITHIHLLPFFDYASVDEAAALPNFNWGYDPANYNIPEGSYSTNASDGVTRIRELKQLIQTLHTHGLGIIIDVVYNHTFATEDSCFHKIVPNYYHRTLPDSTFSNGSGCGNETASERPMVRRYIVDSVVYWAKEYHIDGFRFDLMGLHDIDTMQAIRKALDEISPAILIYGEGWTGGASPLPEDTRASKQNIAKLPGIAAFNDNLRDTIKGNVFSATDKGFVSGKHDLTDELRLGICACCAHPALPAALRSDPNACWAAAPTQSINYVSAHDNLTLWDKLTLSNPDVSRKQRIQMNQLAAAIYLTSQGIPFFQAGEEFLRSKPKADGSGFDENSYNAPDSVNSIKWDELTENLAVFEYYKGLISFRKAHPALRLTTTEALAECLHFLENTPDNTVAYCLSGAIAGESLQELLLLFNPNPDPVCFSILPGNWNIYAAEGCASAQPIGQLSGSSILVAGISCTILGR
ncbi:MAG: type I pullulanase [Lachnospiraceae bacterium]|nr:type I pullulanase [Lachnospiraceae bacterium]